MKYWIVASLVAACLAFVQAQNGSPIMITQTSLGTGMGSMTSGTSPSSMMTSSATSATTSNGAASILSSLNSKASSMAASPTNTTARTGNTGSSLSVQGGAVLLALSIVTFFATLA
ncbi:hypothetical protein EC973_009263 [Apophysomyces ossiformis]|uniref:Uncharacterized protein n=1 Tax=Apophysomyces ossiformis TaxID=679940 RepID=A0A8H7BLT8_9FUNG|nr:hypothetical protein EC973_009263 [Apophysomyces ossiformis]